MIESEQKINALLPFRSDQVMSDLPEIYLLFIFHWLISSNLLFRSNRGDESRRTETLKIGER
jgi:hypothetical protein